MELHENMERAERALLLAIDDGSFDCEESLDELAELAKTAGAEVVGKASQKRAAPNTATYVGKGRLEEIKELCASMEVDLVIADDELSPSQIRNLEAELDVRVIDRTTLILDIFAGRARTSEGKLQVELAQAKYALPRLTGKGKALSRLGGGIGTRGPGESKLESDRRHIRRRIYTLEQDLKELQKRRGALRARRKKDGVETVAIVGYTNAGKSTLMNRLTEAGVLVEDQLFATLDPTARKLALPDGREVMLVDTVGFIRRLPHHLVEAFGSTLEEAVQADVILNVCDASDPACSDHLAVTAQILDELHCGGKPVIAVFNKCDLLEQRLDITGKDSVRLSAATGEGVETLLQAIAKALPPTRRQVTVLLPFSEGSLAAVVRREGKVLEEEYLENGLKMTAIVDLRLLDRLTQYVQ